MAEEKQLIDLVQAKNRQRHYETIFVVAPQVTDQLYKEFVDRIVQEAKNLKATVLRQDDWGKKRMAYAIEKHQIARYFYLRFVGTGASVDAIERLLKLEATVLRFQTIVLSEVLTAEEIEVLAEKAPREPSSSPTIRYEDEEAPLEVAYH